MPSRADPDVEPLRVLICTPRRLTQPIVAHALEPALERLGSDATSDQILDLKVCDPAMGSGLPGSRLAAPSRLA